MLDHPYIRLAEDIKGNKHCIRGWEQPHFLRCNEMLDQINFSRRNIPPEQLLGDFLLVRFCFISFWNLDYGPREERGQKPSVIAAAMSSPGHSWFTQTTSLSETLTTRSTFSPYFSKASNFNSLLTHYIHAFFFNKQHNILPEAQSCLSFSLLQARVHVAYLLLVDYLRAGTFRTKYVSESIVVLMCPYLPFFFLSLFGFIFRVFCCYCFFACWENALEAGLFLRCCSVFWKIWALCCL